MPSQPDRPAGSAGKACALVLAASPHREGSAVLAARALVQGMQAAGTNAELLDLSLLSFEGCRHCGACGRAPHACARAPFDDCEAVFARLCGASFAAFAVPACALFLAGRTAGRRLFEGVGLELRCFCRTMGLDLRKVKEVRGVEKPPEAGGAVLADIEAFGRRLWQD